MNTKSNPRQTLNPQAGHDAAVNSDKAHSATIQNFISQSESRFESIIIAVIYKEDGEWFQYSGFERKIIHPTYSGFNHHLKQIESFPLNKSKGMRTVFSLAKLFKNPGYTLGIPFSKPDLVRAWLLIHSPPGKMPGKKITNKLRFGFERLCEECGAFHTSGLKSQLEKKTGKELTLVTFAHQLKSPLNVLETIFMRDGDLKKGKRDAIKAALRKIKGTRKFIQDFLFFSREKKNSFGPVNMKGFFEELRHFYDYDPTVKNVDLEIKDVHLPDNFSIQGNKTLLFQVFQNLVENAVRAMKGVGRIKIKIGKKLGPGENHLRITVSDSGPGIPLQEIENSFRPFHSGSGSYGVGLSVCRDSLKLHGGNIDYNPPEKGKHGYFEILFPLNERA